MAIWFDNNENMIFDTETILMLVTVTFNTFLGTVIFIHGGKKRSDISYGVLVLMLVFWTLAVLGIRLSHSYQASLLYLASSYVAGLGIAISFWYFVEVYIGKIVKFKNLLLISLPAVLIAFLAYVSPNYVIDIQNLDSLNKNLVLGPLHFLFVIYFTGLMVYALSELYLAYKHPPQSIATSGVVSVFLGTFLSTAVGATFNIYYLIVGVSRYIAWGPISTMIMVLFIAYAIIKHNLMSIKLISSEVFAIALLLTLAVRLTLSNTLGEWFINSISLGISLLVSIFLIRSVYKEVRQREQIEQLAGDLKKANEGQLNLIHFMNHQVKGRFGNAKNIFAELLTGDYGSMPNESRPLLEKGLEETNMGVDYVQSILRGASAESGTLPYDMKPIDFKSVVEESFRKQKENAEKRGLSMELHVASGNYGMSGDATELGESVRNLMDNSITYTLSGSIKVNLSRGDKNIRLEVKDTGVGISDEDKVKLFKSGGRGTESLKVNTNSTGYGLAFVKGVVEAHKGRVWAESEGKGRGSTFIIELPAA